jgi:tetratricopeptide (TPR) repeat protein
LVSKKNKRRRALLIVALALALVTSAGGIAWYVRSQSKSHRLGELKDQAKIHLRLGEHDQAVAVLQEAFELEPEPETFASLSLLLAFARNALGEHEEAERVLVAALEADPENHEVVITLGRHLLNQRRPAEALALLEPRLDWLRELQDASQRCEAMLLCGRALAGAGELEPAIDLLRETAVAREKFGLRKLATGDQRVEGLWALGQTLAQAGRQEEAEVSLREARELAPEAIQVNVLLSRLLEASGRVDEAAGLLREVLDSSSERRLAVVIPLGELLVRRGRLAEADSLVAELAEESEAEASRLYLQASIALTREDIDGARGHLSELITLNPSATQARLLLARIALSQGRTDEARSGLAEALEADPDSIEAELLLLELDEQAERWPAVRARAERLLEDPDARTRAMRSLLALVSRDGRTGSTRARLSELLAARPADPSLAFLTAVLEVLDGDVEAGAARLLEVSQRDERSLQQALGLLTEGSGDALEAVALLGDLADRDPKLAPARLLLAKIFARLGSFELAQREVEAAVAHPETSAEARLLRVQLLIAQGQVAQAADDLAAWLAESEDLGLRLTLADLRAASGDLEGAEAVLTNAPQDDPRIQVRRGVVMARRGRTADGVDQVRRARQRDESLPEVRLEGVLHLLDGEVERARRALERDTQGLDAPPLIFALAVCWSHDRRYGEAARAAGRLQQRGPLEVLTHAVLLRWAGDLNAARALLERLRVPEVVLRSALDARDDDPLLRELLVGEVARRLNWRERVERCARRVADDPRATPLALWWARASLDAGAPADLRVQLARALRGTSDDTALTLDLAAALLLAGDEEGERGALEEVLATDPHHAAALLRLGMNRERDGQPAEARPLYERIVAGDASSPIALNNLAYMLGQDPVRRAQALGYARRAVALAPRVGAIQDTLGWVLYLDGRLEEAHRVLERAVELDPRAGLFRYHLARTLVQEGALQRATRQIELALRASQGFAESAEAEELLGVLRGELAMFAAPPARSLEPGASAAASLDARGLVTLGLPAGETGLQVTPPDGQVVSVTLATGSGEVLLRVPDSAGLRLDRLAAPDGCVLGLSGAPGLEVSVQLPPATPAPFEPDGPLRANPLAAGETLTGTFDGPADRDFVSLAALTEGRGRLRVESNGGGLLVDLLVANAGVERLLRRSSLADGETLEAGQLVNEGGTLMIRVAAAAPDTVGWSLAWGADTAPPTDAEPNDRLEDAIVFPGSSDELAGRLSPADLVDAYRLTGRPRGPISLELETTGDPLLALEVWQPGPNGPRGRVFTGRGGVSVPGWALPSGGALVFVRAPRGLAEDVAYRLVLGAPAPAPAETEPNDEPASAEDRQFPAQLTGDLAQVGDGDWVLVRAAPEQFSLEVERSAASPATLVVGVYSRQGDQFTAVARYATRGQRLEVPLVSRADAGELMLFVTGVGREPGGGYSLKVGPAGEGDREPNDDPDHALPLVAGSEVAGRLSGEADRDVYSIDATRRVFLTATGEGTLRWRLWGDPEEHELAPGAEASVLLGPRDCLEVRRGQLPDGATLPLTTYRLTAP